MGFRLSRAGRGRKIGAGLARRVRLGTTGKSVAADIVGRWRSSEDFEAWTQTDSHIQTKAALDSCQTADPEIERLQSVLIVDSADA